MMGGSIKVEDNYPKGSVFTVTVPVTEAVETVIEELPANTDDVPVSESNIENDVQSKPTIMVVDDNMDARLFLQRSLEKDYNVVVASNGQEALQLLDKSDDVNLIVSDVMMPVMDGMELLRKVKANIKFSHIPVILLTAKSGEENIVSGLKEDAADYITKPFSLSVLQLRVKKILEWTQNIHQQVATGIEIKPSEITVSSLDEELISRVIAFIENNIQKSDYSVVDLSNDVGMTRGHLYKKLQAITGKSPLEFMRIIKLKRGKSLLEQGRTNISEVADRVGMSPKQFSLYFKQMFGDTPSDFLKKFK
jgi:DNA-binding response OmpR family regulator